VQFGWNFQAFHGRVKIRKFAALFMIGAGSIARDF
jgi:hypothetical protein